MSFAIVKKTMSAGFGSQEMQDYNAIKDLEQKIFDCNINKEKESDKKLKELYEQKLDILWLQYRNTFEALCSRYLTKNKIDRENFKKMYKYIIIELVDKHKDKYNPTSKFDATMKVYMEFKRELDKENSTKIQSKTEN